MMVDFFVSMRRVATCLLSVYSITAHATAYDDALMLGAEYLISQQAQDGSWQSTGSEARYLETVEATLALQAFNARVTAFWSGITWLGNHSPDNTDYRSRRVLTLAAQNAVTIQDMAAIQSAQLTGSTANGGYGLSDAYMGAPQDTVMALQALKMAGQSAGVSSAKSYLVSTQRTVDPKGWPAMSNGAFDAATTAQVLIGLHAYLPDTALTTPVANAATALKASVSAVSPFRLRALTALAYVKTISATDAYAVSLLNSLLAAQAQDGRWGSGVYDTALAMRAIATAASTDLTSNRTSVSVVDEKLRAAINRQLGRNAMDQLNRGEMRLLTHLLVPNMGITNITGLEHAINLSMVDLSGNAIGDLTPLASVNAQTNCQGNPGCITTSITLTATPRAVQIHKPITLKAELIGGNNRGTMTFARDGIVLAENLAINSQGVATATVALPKGAYVITANYSGDYAHAPSQSQIILRIPNLGWLPAALKMLQE